MVSSHRGSSLSLPFESAFISAVSQTFPTSTLQFCSFHFSQSMFRRLSTVQSNPTKNKILSEIWTVLKACPYIPWSQELRDEFFEILEAKQRRLPQNIRENFSNFLSYLYRTYFSDGKFSFLVNSDYDYFGDFGQNDLSNNSVECRNYCINSYFTTGRKTLKYYCSTITQFKKDHYSERLFALRGNDLRYLRKRTPEQQQKFEERRSKSLSFARLSQDDQKTSLYIALLDLGNYSPTQNP